LCAFHNKVDESIVAAMFEEQAKGLSPEKRAELKRRFDTLDRNRCFKSDPHSGEPREVVFTVETVCAMDPAYLVFAALRVLTNKVEGFAKALVSGDADIDNVLTWTTIGGMNGFYQMTMKNETHTLGNLLQSEFYRRFVSNNAKSDKFLEFIGYHVPHPLERNFLMKWKFSQEVDLDTARDWILVGANQIIQHLTQLTHEWLAVCKLNVDEYTEVVEFVTANPSSDPLPVPVPVPEKPQRKKIDRK
jgi:DNA-directed RNA polymerase subunit L